MSSFVARIDPFLAQFGGSHNWSSGEVFMWTVVTCLSSSAPCHPVVHPVPGRFVGRVQDAADTPFRNACGGVVPSVATAAPRTARRSTVQRLCEMDKDPVSFGYRNTRRTRPSMARNGDAGCRHPHPGPQQLHRHGSNDGVGRAGARVVRSHAQVCAPRPPPQRCFT